MNIILHVFNFFPVYFRFLYKICFGFYIYFSWITFYRKVRDTIIDSKSFFKSILHILVYKLPMLEKKIFSNIIGRKIFFLKINFFFLAKAILYTKMCLEDLEANGPHAHHHQPLEQRLRQAGARRLLAHHHRAQLAVVPHQHLFGQWANIISERTSKESTHNWRVFLRGQLLSHMLFLAWVGSIFIGVFLE